MIVVVEDELDTLALLCVVLEEEGYHVQGCSDPRALADAVGGDERPRLFLLDIMLPDHDGMTLAAMLKHRGFGDTPMIAMSASPVMLRAAQQSNLFQETL